MPQLLLQGFPDGATRIGTALSVLKKDGRVTYFVGGDTYFSHAATDAAGQRFALAALIANGHVRPCEVEASSLGIPHRTLMNWTRQSAERGPGSFYAPRRARGGTVMTPEKAAECGRLIDAGRTVPEAARLACVNGSTLRKAFRGGRVARAAAARGTAPEGASGTDKSERSAADARAAEGMGTACTRAGERMAAAAGLAGGVSGKMKL